RGLPAGACAWSNGRHEDLHYRWGCGVSVRVRAMTTIPESSRLRWNAAAWLAAFLFPGVATAQTAGPEPWPAVRSHNPFLQIFGLSAFEAGSPVAAGETRYAID